MATTSNSVILYAFIVALVGFALASIAVWSRRDVRMRLAALALSLIGAPVIWFAFAQLPGKPDGISTEDFRANYRCATILPYPEIRKQDGLYMLIKKKKQRDAEYLHVEWNLKLASSLQKSVRVAQMNGKGSIIYGSASCKDDEDGEDGQGKGKGKGKKGKGKGAAGAAGSRHPTPGIQRPGSSGQENSGDEEFNFYPDPVPPQEEKNYESNETPLVMPERH